MANEQKGRSPFSPGQPVPVELFRGRATEIGRLLQRGVGQTALGKPTAFFVQGEYGIGKSSIAQFIHRAADVQDKLVGLYAALGGARTLDDIAARVLEATLRSGMYDPTLREQVQGWLSKLGKPNLFGVGVDLTALRLEAPKLASAVALLSFLDELQTRNAKVRNGKGVLLILDEINGIADNPEFAHFLKTLIDTNAIQKEPLPLMLMLCGVEERRQQLIANHQPVERLFDVIDIAPLADAEVSDFFTAAFGSVGLPVSAGVLERLVTASAGQPKIMHTVGDCVFWRAKPGVQIDLEAGLAGIFDAADEVGKKYVDAQVLAAIRSADYQSILRKLAAMIGPQQKEFTKKELTAELTDTEKRKLDNFLTKLKTLNVIKAGAVRGSYQFRIHMVQMYLWLRSQESDQPPLPTRTR